MTATDQPGTEHGNRPRREEQEPASDEVTEVAPGILRLQLPVSLPGLGHVNCYVLEDERGVALVDPGLPGPGSWKALVERLGSAGFRTRNVHTVVVTHSHPDHFGAAGTLRHEAGAVVLTHRSFRTWLDAAEGNEADALALDDDDEPLGTGPFDRKLPWKDETFRPPINRLKMMIGKRFMRRYLRAPAPGRRVDDAEVVRLARRDWVSIHTPGHTPDHLCLYDPEYGVVLSGDHVLPTITPHISGLVAGADPLSAFFESLDKVKALTGVQHVLPAHGHPFTDLPGRADAIRHHHEERLATLRSISGELGPTTVSEMSKRLFHPRSWGQMAESETYAHLEHLRINGQARVVDDTAPELVYEVHI